MNFVNSLAHRVTSSFTAGGSPFLVAICGWADTGKSTLAGMLCAELQQQGVKADWISTDAFLMDREVRNTLGLTGYNPKSIDSVEMLKALAQLACGSTYKYFPYVNRTGTRAAQASTIEPQDILVIEGIHALHLALMPQLHYKVFIDAAPDVLRHLRIKANMKKRGMDLQEASRRVDFELEEFGKYIAPAKHHVECVANITESYEYTFTVSTEPVGDARAA